MTLTSPPDFRAHAVPPAPPIKRATWEWYIPIYFWLGGISAGSWIAAAAEDLTGGRNRRLIGTARWLSLGTLLGGTALLIADLGRPERFHHMLRIVRARSAMSLGSWGLTAYGGVAGRAAMLQAGEAGWLGRRAALARLSRGGAGRAVHVAGLPLAAFVGSYTGVLLASTSTPSWEARAGWLGPLFLSSALSSGIAAVALAADLGPGLGPGARRRLARAEAVALAAELALLAQAGRASRPLPSERRARPKLGAARALVALAGMALPLGLAIARGAGRKRRGRRRQQNHALHLAGATLALGGSLALRYLVTHEGYRSADTPEDTWRITSGGDGAPGRRPVRGPQAVEPVLADGRSSAPA